MKIDQDEQINDGNTLVIFNFQENTCLDGRVADQYRWTNDPNGAWCFHTKSAAEQRLLEVEASVENFTTGAVNGVYGIVTRSYAKSRTGRPSDPQLYTQLNHAHV